MRLTAQSLPAELKSGLAGIYVLYGQETLLVEESLDAVRSAARSNNVDETVRYLVEPGVDWSQIAGAGQMLSLFSSRRLLEIRMPGGRPGDAGSKVLAELANCSSDNVIVVICGRLEKAATGSKWFKAADTGGVCVDHPQVTRDALPGWINSRSRNLGLDLEQGVVERIIYYLEGNLLAADQELRKLSALAGEGSVSLELLEKSVADSARFSAFALVDACLSGDAARALRILGSLRSEGFEPVLVNWTFAREIRLLAALGADIELGEAKRDAFRSRGVWSSRSRLVSSALARLDRARCERLLGWVAALDRMIKGRQGTTVGNIWAEFESLALALSGREPVNGSSFNKANEYSDIQTAGV